MVATHGAGHRGGQFRQTGADGDHRQPNDQLTDTHQGGNLFGPTDQHLGTDQQQDQTTKQRQVSPACRHPFNVFHLGQRFVGM